MAIFIKDNFTIDAGWVHYTDDTHKNLFIARCRNQADAKPFVTFLKKNFTVEEYIALYNDGVAPLKILETKGYVSPNVKKLLRSLGYPATQEGFTQYLERNKA